MYRLVQDEMKEYVKKHSENIDELPEIINIIEVLIEYVSEIGEKYVG